MEFHKRLRHALIRQGREGDGGVGVARAATNSVHVSESAAGADASQPVDNEEESAQYIRMIYCQHHWVRLPSHRRANEGFHQLMYGQAYGPFKLSKQERRPSAALQLQRFACIIKSPSDV